MNIDKLKIVSALDTIFCIDKNFFIGFTPFTTWFYYIYFFPENRASQVEMPPKRQLGIIKEIRSCFSL